MIGKTLAHYEIIDLLGKGGMGEVYRAHDTKLDRDVALKLLPATVAADPARLERFQREAKTVAALSHPNIVTLFSVEEDAGVRFLTMEMVDGRGLDEILTEKSLPLDRIVEIGIAVADALDAAHNQGIVHRDLKPANVMLTSDGRVKVLDFGLAKATAERSASEDEATEILTLTREGSVLGTAPFMSPEQLRGEEVDPRSDIFSLGVLLYQLATGKHPFQGTTMADVGAAILRASPTDPGELRTEIPKALETHLLRCLEKDPVDRFQTAAELRAALVGLDSSAPPSRRGHWWRLRNSWSIGLGVGVLLVATHLMNSRRNGPDDEQILSLAVLPFTNLSGDSSQNYFADGFTDQLTTTLADVEALKVIARTSAAGYRQSSKRASTIGEELSVDGLVTGSVLRAGEEVRITAQLVSAKTERNVWARSYNRRISNIFSLQAEVARSIADAIQVQLSPEDVGRLDAAREIDSRAVDAYLRGRSLWKQRTETSVREGLAQFESALRIAPEFALAHSGLADSYIILAVHGYEPPKKAMPLAKEAARYASNLDPSAGEPHASLGDIAYHYDWDWDTSERKLRRAIELSPNFATAHQWLAEPLAITGRFEEAIESLHTARTLDPLSLIIRTQLAGVLVLAGRTQDAIDELREALRLNPRFPRAQTDLARFLLLENRDQEALAAAREVVASHPDYISGRAVLGHCLARLGQADEARAILAELEAQRAHRHISSMDLAFVTAGFRDRSATLDHLRQAVADQENCVEVGEKPEFAFLAGDPDFEQIWRSIGLPDRAAP